jgi:hypothetical protein
MRATAFTPIKIQEIARMAASNKGIGMAASNEFRRPPFRADQA